jgi:hypothetical protein
MINRSFLFHSQLARHPKETLKNQKTHQ